MPEYSMSNQSIPGFLVYTHIFRREPIATKANNTTMPESVRLNSDYVGQGIIRTMVCHLIEFVRHHGPALESIRINPTWLREDKEEKQKPRRRKIWVHGTPPPPTGWELVEKCNFLEDLNIPQVLLDPCLSPNVVIASIADVVPRFVLGIIEHSPDPIVVGQEVYCPRCGLVGQSKVFNVTTMTHEGPFKCLNQLCDFEQYPVKEMPAQEQEAIANRGLSLGTPRAPSAPASVLPITHPAYENVGGALEDIRRRSLYVDPAPNEDRTVLRAGGGNIPIARGGDQTREVAREQLRVMRAGIRGNWERAHAGEENLHYPGDPLPPYQTETNSEGEERGPGRIDINNAERFQMTETAPPEDDIPDSDEEGEDGSIRRSQFSERFADMVRGRRRTNQGLRTPAEHRQAHDPLAQTLYDLERGAGNEQERKVIQDIANSYLSGQIDGATVQRALQRIAREPNPGRGNRRR